MEDRAPQSNYSVSLKKRVTSMKPQVNQKLRLPLLFLPLIRFLARSQPFGSLAEKVLEKQPEEPSMKSKSFEEQNGAAPVRRSGFLGMRSQLDLTLC